MFCGTSVGRRRQNPNPQWILTSMERFPYRLTSAFLLACLLSLAAAPAVGQVDPGPPDLSGGLLGNGAEQGLGAGKNNNNAVKNPVTVEAQFTAPAAGKPGRLFVTAVIAPGWHIYSITQPTSEKGNPTVTKIQVKLPPGVRLAGPFKPSVAPEKKTEPDAYGDLPIENPRGRRHLACAARTGRRRRCGEAQDRRNALLRGVQRK